MRAKTLVLLFLGALCLPAVAAFADLTTALTDYKSGVAKEKAKDYPGAVVDLQASLREDPSVTGAQKQLGNCFYYLGDLRRALKHYDLYLLSHPDDDATFAFAENLRKNLRAQRRDRLEDGGRRDRADTADLDAAAPRRGSFYAGLSGSLFFPSASDVQNIYGNAGSSVGTNYGFAEEEHLGYLWANGFGLEGGFEYVDRETTLTDTYEGSSYPVDYTVVELGVFVEPLYRFRLGGRSALIAGLQVGASEAVLAGDSYGGYGYGDAYGGALVLTPDVRYQFLFGGRFGLELGAQYRLADFDTLNNTDGYSIVNSSGGTWHLSDSGLAVRLGFDFYFHRQGE